MIFVLASLCFGIISWVLPVLSLVTKEKTIEKRYIFSMASFVFCLVSIYIQILLMNTYAEQEEQVGMMWDSIGALNTAVPILIFVAIALNVFAVWYTKNKAKTNTP